MIHRMSIGIDPGRSSGGLAVVMNDNQAEAHKMPATDRDIWDLIRGWGCVETPTFAYLEQVSAMPGQGVTSMFKFGSSYGELKMALIAAGIPFEMVRPAKWQRALGCLSGGDKNVTKAKAQELFPDLKITHAIADALLIAEYGRRVRAGEL